MLPFWQDLYMAGADIALGAHAHFYEQPINPQDNLDANASCSSSWARAGKSRGGLAAVFGARHPQSATATAATLEVLELTLINGWDFVVEESNLFTDTGTKACNP